MFKPEWEEALKEPLNDKNVKKRQQYSYITSHHAIREANTIFGHGEWSTAVDRLDCVAQTKNGKGNNVVTYLAVVTVTVNGISRQDTGTGNGINSDLGACHEGASKEAVSDALKRSLRTFGDRFGLALYDAAQTHVISNQTVEQNDRMLKELNTAIKRGERDLSRAKLKDCMQAGLVKKNDRTYLLCIEAFPSEEEKQPAKTAIEEKVETASTPIKNCKTITTLKSAVKKLSEEVRNDDEFKKVVKETEEKIAMDKGAIK